MIIQKHTQIHMAALISILLLIGQFSVLSHSVEHSFHAQDQSCEIFIQCETSGNGLISPALQFLILASNSLYLAQLVSSWLPSVQSAYYARGPPSFL